MLVNADFTQRAIVAGDDPSWVASPMQGVERIMLDRVGDEVARATSIVRYAAGSSFNRHLHPLGEEFLVLEGTFSDEHGDFPVGTYVRNPPGSGHSPHSQGGCRILVKLRQFDERDLTPVCIDTRDESLWISGESPGERELPLHQFDSEAVVMREYTERFSCQRRAPAGGLEWFIVAGEVQLDDVLLPASSWVRLPGDAELDVRVTSRCRLWEKTGHLR